MNRGRRKLPTSQQDTAIGRVEHLAVALEIVMEVLWARMSVTGVDAPTELKLTETSEARAISFLVLEMADAAIDLRKAFTVAAGPK